MIDWRFPYLLGGLISVPLLIVFLIYALRKRRTDLQRFAEARLLPTLTPDLDLRRHHWRAVLGVIAASLALVAAAGPRWGFHWEEVHREGIDLVIALDTSRSMLAEDVKPNRLERAKLALQDLVRQLNGDRVGLVAFSGAAFVQCPLTLDYEVFNETLRAINTDIIPKGGTAVAEAVSTSIEALAEHQGKHAAILLVTDGEDHEGKVEEAAQVAADKGIKIYTVGIGTSDGELIPLTVNGQPTFLKDRRGQVVKSRLDRNTLEAVATTTGGAFVHGSGPSLGLDEIYSEYISQMEKRELKSTVEKRFEERFQLPLVLAFALLAVEPLISNRRAPTSSSRHWPVWRRRRSDKEAP